jgi:D-alanyl-D-alanine carboxypeptidase-like protein/LysM domain-containing protein
MQFYTVRQGDSLWRIASLIYHDGNLWPLIAKANQIGAPSRLTIGQRLVVPNGSPEPPSAAPAPAPVPDPVAPPPPAPDDPLLKIAPVLAGKARSLIESCRQAGVDIRVSQALRTWREQDALYAQGRTAPGAIRTYARGGESFHNFGMAFDIVLLESGRVTWDAHHRGWRVAGEIGTGLGLLWGGNWKSLKDLPHFEMRGQLTLRDCRALYPAGLPAVWARLL